MVFVSSSLSVFQKLCPVCGIGETSLLLLLQNRFTNAGFRQCLTEMFSLQNKSWRYIYKINKRTHYTIWPTKICNKLSFFLCFIHSFFFGIHFPATSRHFYFRLVHSVNASLWEHAASFSIGARGQLSGQKTDHLSWSSTKVTNALNYTSTPHVPSLLGACLCSGKISYFLTSYQYWSERVLALDSERSTNWTNCRLFEARMW